jgi:hypothetical protein
MKSLLLLITILAAWYFLNRWIIPLLGVET